MRNGPVIRIGPGEEFPKDIPPQYLKGWVEFYKLKFKVTPDVLIPRPETELLVDEVLKGVEPLTQHTRGFSPVVLDIGTGSGCIAISVAKNSPKARIFATDISEPALDIARENAKKNRMQKRIFFIKSDLLSFLERSHLSGGETSVPDVMVANLPYIPSSRIGTLDPSVKDFEPTIALDGGPDGFDLYRKLFAEMKEKNLIPKLFVGEIDDSHETLALSETKKYFPQALVEVKTDLSRKPRILLVNFN